MFNKLVESAKVVYYTLGFFTLGCLAVLIFLLAPIILTCLVGLIILFLSVVLAKQYVDSKVENKEDD